jgi:hypothetical protein
LVRAVRLLSNLRLVQKHLFEFCYTARSTCM